MPAQPPNAPHGPVSNTGAQATPSPRKPYVPPAVVYEQKLEAVAANCSVSSGKAPGACTFGFS